MNLIFYYSLVYFNEFSTIKKIVDAKNQKHDYFDKKEDNGIKNGNIKQPQCYCC